MIKIGITGQAGFVGTHLYNTLGLYSDQFERIPFYDSFFQDVNQLNAFAKSCDVIVHLAAMNRHTDAAVLYQTNIKLVTQLIESCEATNSTPHILFSSSTQEERDNLYGKSKREGRLLFEKWAKRNNALFTAFVIPNVFGPFGNPYYNSVVATFCYQLTHNEQPRIEVDGELKLIYVSELVKELITKIIETQKQTTLNNFANVELNERSTELETQNLNSMYFVPHTSTIKVSELLSKLNSYKELYFNNGTIPNLDTPFDRNLFNTFLCYIDHSNFFPFPLKKNTDNRGSFIETMRLSSGGQVSFSTTVSGITRGNHFHTRKAERFAVIRGKARIEIRRIGTQDVLIFELNGNEPSFVDMPIWHTHNITNIGNEDLYTIFWINEHFSPTDQDTYFEKVKD
jgi:UDP-2-acetamido-2,6-beta-L-arabino-hexul-4-ose reductase